MSCDNGASHSQSMVLLMFPTRMSPADSDLRNGVLRSHDLTKR